jgi:signal transduction histidine kinase/sugar lactone lactonase YvrE
MFYGHPQFQFIYKRPWSIKKAWLARKGFFRRLAFALANLCFVASVVLLNIWLLPFASAATPRPAIDALGQTDATFNNPSYTTLDQDNTSVMPQSNHIGFHFPYSEALDSVNHRLFIADNQNNRVVVHSLDASNHFSSTSAVHAIGQAGFSTNTKNFASSDCTSGTVTPTQSTMCAPGSIVYDSAGQRLFVADTGWKRVLVYDLSGGITDNMNASFVLGQANFTTFPASCAITQKTVCKAGGMAYDSANKLLFVGDGSRVMVFDLSSGITSNMDATYVLGQSSFTSNSCGASTQNSVCLVYGITYDSATKRLFVSDKTRNRITEFDLSSGITSNMNAAHVLGQANYTATGCNITQSGLCQPAETSFDSGSSLLYVGDSSNNRVMIFDLSSGITDGMNASHVLGQTIFTSNATNSNQSTAAQTRDPMSVLADSANNQLFVIAASDSRVQRYDLSGGITDGMNAIQEVGQTNMISGASSFTLNQPDNQNPNASGYYYPTGVKMDPVRHRLFVADTENNRVLIYNLDSGNNLTSHVPDFVLGEPDFDTTHHNCWTSPSTYVTQSSLCEPMAMYVDVPNDLLYVADYSMVRVMVYDLSGGITNNMNAAHVLGQPNFTTSSNHCSGTVDTSHYCQNVGGITYDPTHKQLYVADQDNNRVLVYDLSSGITDGMAASHVLGQANFTDSLCNSGGGPTASSICFLDIQDFEGMDYDTATDTLFLADGQNQRVKIYDMSGGVSDNMAAVHVLGEPNLTTSGCAHTQASFCDAYDLQYVPSIKKLFVSDTFNNRVMIFDLYNGITDGMNAQAQIGQTSFTTTAAATTQTGMDTPYGVYYDTTSGKLYVGDENNQRVMVYSIGFSITTTSLPDGEVGTAYSSTINTEDQSGSVSFGTTTGALPPGLSLDGGTGAITGTPTTPGTYTFTIQATDETGATASQSYSLRVSSPYLASDLIGQVDGSGNPIWTNGGSNNTSGSVNNQGLSNPTGSVMDTVHHRLFVADSSNSRVLVFNLDSSNNLIDRTADNVLGEPDLTSGGDFANCTFNSGTPSASNMCEPMSPAYDPNNNRLFVPDSQDSRILVFDLSGGISNGMAASWVLGEPDFATVSCTTAQNTVCSPSAGATYDASTDRLYVGDTGNSRVLVFNLSGGITTGMNASFVLGQNDFTTANTPNLTQNGLGSPEGMALDNSNHRLFVADWSSGGRVLVFDTSSLSNGMNAANVLGETDFVSSNSASDLGNPPDAKSFGPVGLAYDPNHQLLFVEDDNISRIMIFDVNSITNDEDAVGVLGQPNLTTDNGCGTSQKELCFPFGQSEYYDAANNRLYSTDNGNSRIMIFSFAKLASPAPDGTVGSAYSFGTDSYSQGDTTFSLTSGALPNGVNLNTSTGDLTGTPTTAGTFNFALHMVDNNQSPGTFTDDQSYSVNIATAGGGDTQAPTVPIGLQVTGTTTTTITIAWNPSTDNIGVTGYNIYRDGGSTPIAVVGGTGFTDTGLNPQTTYTYTVTAIDAANNESGHSNQASGTTDANPTGGGGDQGGNQGGNNQGGGGGNQNNQSSTPVPSAPIDLDNQPGIDSTGYTTDADNGQTFTFTDSSDDGHTIVVGPVDSSGSAIKIDDSSQHADTGQTISKDVDNDGKDDIDITVNKVVDNNTVNLTFHKIIFAIAPGGSTGNNGVGAGGGSSPVQKAGPGFFSSLLKHIPKAALFIFPWLLFILLGLSVARLTYLSVQERRFAAKLAAQLAREKTLAEAKNNFITLTSHYLRTPVTTISTGIELAAALNPDAQAKSQLTGLSSQLNSGVNTLLAQAQYRAPAEIKAPEAGSVVSAGLVNPSPSLAGGFIQLDSLRAITIALAAAFGLIGLTDFILAHVDLYNVGLIHILEQLAGLLLVGILLLASLRSYRKRKELRQQAEKLLAGQRELDAARNTLIKNSLESLKQPLQELKAKLSAAPATNPKALKPALDGIAQLEGLLAKFVIASSLESGSMARNTVPVDINQMAGGSIQRYTRAIQGKFLAVKNEVHPATVNQDPLLVSFVLDSLLNNAIKYSPQNSEITITGGQHSGGVEISVADRGLGIPEDKQAQLFEAFGRAENAAVDFNTQGAGLSLYLDRLVMDYLGGQIALSSQPGQGTTVAFNLPA